MAQSPTVPMDNRRALPPPVESSRPGPGDWVNKGGAVFDGDYITLRCNAWDGMTAYHSWDWNTLQVAGDKGEARPTPTRNKRTPGPGEGLRSSEGGPDRLSLQRVRMDNKFSFCIRRIIFDAERQAYVLPSWTAWQDRRPIKMTDTVVFLVPNDPSRVLGTRNPPSSLGNNGDYAVGLYEFPLATRADLDNTGLGGGVATFLSFGFWQNGVDFLNQSRCVWTFNSVYDNRQNLVYGGNVINIQNMWTKVKSGNVGVGQFITSPLLGIINSTFTSGRNLAIHDSWVDGKILRLSLISNDHADTEGWIIDGWHGNTYPVQRAMLPTEPPPVTQETRTPILVGRRPDPPPYIPNLTDQIRHPPPIPPPVVDANGHTNPSMTIDPVTGTARNTWLEHATQEQNPDDCFDYISKLIYGKRWALLSIGERINLTALAAFGVFAGVEIAIKEI